MYQAIAVTNDMTIENLLIIIFANSELAESKLTIFRVCLFSFRRTPNQNDRSGWRCIGCKD